MRQFPDYPFGVIRSAMHSVAGWAMVIGVSLVLGIWLGLMIDAADFVPPRDVLLTIFLLPYAWIFCVPVFVGYGVTAIAWYLPLRYESGRLKLAMALVHLIAWCAITASCLARF
jgi:hypothetical protein